MSALPLPERAAALHRDDEAAWFSLFDDLKTWPVDTVAEASWVEALLVLEPSYTRWLTRARVHTRAYADTERPVFGSYWRSGEVGDHFRRWFGDGVRTHTAADSEPALEAELVTIIHDAPPLFTPAGPERAAALVARLRAVDLHHRLLGLALVIQARRVAESGDHEGGVAIADEALAVGLADNERREALRSKGQALLALGRLGAALAALAEPMTPRGLHIDVGGFYAGIRPPESVPNSLRVACRDLGAITDATDASWLVALLGLAADVAIGERELARDAFVRGIDALAAAGNRTALERVARLAERAGLDDGMALARKHAAEIGSPRGEGRG